MNLKLLVENVDDEEQNHADERASGQVDARGIEKIELESIYRERKGNDADGKEQRDEDAGKREPPLSPFRDAQAGLMPRPFLRIVRVKAPVVERFCERKHARFSRRRPCWRFRADACFQLENRQRRELLQACGYVVSRRQS